MKPEQKEGNDGMKHQASGVTGVTIVFGVNNSTATSSKVLMVCQNLKKGSTNTLYPKGSRNK